MQKNAWVDTMSSLVLAALCLLLRWLQNMSVFEADTGLAKPGSALSFLTALVMLGAAVAVFILCRRLRFYDAPTEPQEAFAKPHWGLLAVLGTAALGAAAGSALLYFKGSDLLTKAVALLSLLAVPSLMFFPFLPQWGLLGALLSLNPVVFFSFWLVTAYREYARNPVVWSYAPIILAIATMLLAVYFLCGYLHYRARPWQTVCACTLAPVFGLTVLMDSVNVSARIILASWSVGLLALAGLLIVNMRLRYVSEEDNDEGSEEY